MLFWSQLRDGDPTHATAKQVLYTLQLSFALIMDSFSVGLKRGKRRRGRAGLGTNGLAQPQAASGFGGDDDSGDEKPRAKPVTRVVSSVRNDKPDEPRGVIKEEVGHNVAKKEEDVGQARGEKKSQIARLVARRRDAERQLAAQASGGGQDEALFRYDVDKCPEQAALTTYESTPVDGFGAALLRSMGWSGNTDGDGADSKDKSDTWKPKLRPRRLGLGAKLGDPRTQNVAKERVPETSSSKGIISKADELREVLKGTESEDEVFISQEKDAEHKRKNDSEQPKDTYLNPENLPKGVTESRPRKRSRFASDERHHSRSPGGSRNGRELSRWDNRSR